jgi:hypothetical protein
MKLEEQLRNDAQSLRELGWFNRAIMMDAGADEIRRLNEEIRKLQREVEVLRLYGNKDCTAMADEVLAKEAIQRDTKP